jgi:acetyl esterase
MRAFTPRRHMVRNLLETLLSRAAARAPVGPLVALATSSLPSTDGKRLDGKTRYLLRLAELAGSPPIDKLTPEVARVELAKSGVAVSPAARRLARVSDMTALDGQNEIPVRVYVPFAKATALPALVYFHGGGWVLGNLDSHDRLCRVLADDGECIVISVNYRLAPEHKFPAAVHDALGAYAWAAREAANLGIDSRRIAVGGDSAGGNLAAVVSQASASGVVPRPAFQLLIYPVTDLGCDTRSYDVFGDGYFLTRDVMLWFRSHYLSDLAEIEDPRVSPLRGEVRHALPPALVMTAGFDPLLDEGRAYAEKMRAAGTDVAYRCYEPLIHGFASVTGAVPAARAALRDATAALRLGFARL